MKLQVSRHQGAGCRGGDRLASMSFAMIYGRTSYWPCRCEKWAFIKSHSALFKRGKILLWTPELPIDVNDGDGEAGEWMWRAGTHGRMHDCSEMLAEMHMPALVALDAQFHGEFDYGYISGEGEDDGPAFKWTMPRLEELTCRSGTVLSLPFVKPLKTLTVAPAPYILRMRFPALLEFLRAGMGNDGEGYGDVQLERLVLDLSKYDGPEFPHITSGLSWSPSRPTDASVLVHLPKLRSLSIDLSDKPNKRLNSALLFFAHASLPALEVFELRCNEFLVRKGMGFWVLMRQLSAQEGRRLNRVRISVVGGAEEKDGSGKKGKGEVLQLRLTKMFEVVKAKKRGRKREKGTKVDVFVKFVNVVSP